MGVLFAIPLCPEHLDPIPERYIDNRLLRREQFRRQHGCLPDPRLTVVEFHELGSEAVRAYEVFRARSRTAQIEAQARGTPAPEIVVLDDDEFAERVGKVPAGELRRLR